MASKGQKFNKYTSEFRVDIVSQYIDEGKSWRYLAKTYGISEDTIKTWVKKYKQGHSLISDNRGRPKKDEDIDYKEKYEILKNFQAFLKAQREKK